MKRVWLVSFILVVASAWVLLFSQQWKHVATLTTDASRDESEIVVDSGASIVVDRDIMLELRDGTFRERYGVKHVHEYHVVLKEKLRRDFVAGSRVFQ